MITLITGSPGNGKTLLVVEWLVNKKWGDRDVYTNVNGISPDLGTIPLIYDHESEDQYFCEHQWHNLPDGSVIVIDEAQYPFPPRNGASKVPEFIEHFSTHRHKGHDIVLLTQSPKLIDRYIFPLVEEHYHVHRTFGLKSTTVLHWQSINEDPQPKQSRSTAVTKRKKFDKKLFNYYRSASVHTDKARIPIKPIIAILFSLVLIGVGVTYGISGFLNAGLEKTDAIEQADPPLIRPTIFGETVGCVPFVVGSYVQECYSRTERVSFSDRDYVNAEE